MLERVLRLSIDYRGFVIVVTLALATLGAYSLFQLPIDAVPDITNRQVQINTLAPSLSPIEMEKLVTFPIETALAGIPGLDHTRSFSRNGFSQITAVFDDATDIFFARQQVSERLSATREALPEEAEPSLGPITTGLGEIYAWTVEFEPRDSSHRRASSAEGTAGWQADGTYRTAEGEILRDDRQRATYLRTVQDWIIKPQLVGIDGVAAIDAIGGYVKQYHVAPRSRELAAYNLGVGDIVTAIQRNNLNTGAGIIESNGEAYVVRADGRVRSIEELAEIVVAERQGVPIRLQHLADVAIGQQPRTGTSSENGEEVVIGTALMLIGANSRIVAHAVDAKLEEINRTLPSGIRAKTVLDRSALVDATIATVRNNLVEGAVLVVAVLFLLLGNLRAAAITALAIPLSMLLAAIGMAQSRISANLMSLGAIDFGLIVDGAVIIVENCMRQLAERQRQLGRPLTAAERDETVRAASAQVRNATAFGEAIIIIVYIPIVFLTGIEGKMFRPMALTAIFALTAAFVLSLTLIPALVASLMRGRINEGENRLLQLFKRGYAPLLRWTLRWRKVVTAFAVALLVGAVALFGRLGQEFTPTLSELDLVVHAIRLPSIGLTQASDMQRELERVIARTPEVAFVFSRTGTAELASDPMPTYISDTFVILKPRDHWPNPDDTKELVRERIAAAIARQPGNSYEMTQPIQMRFNELLAGVRSDLAVKIFGDDFDQLEPAAEAAAAVLRRIEGAADVRVEAVDGAPVLNIDVDRVAAARHGLSLAEVHEVIAAAVGGRKAGEIFEGDRRFDVVVRLPDEARSDLHALRHVPIPLSHVDELPGTVEIEADDVQRSSLRFVPLETVASLSIVDGPNQISRENGKRRIVVQANIRGRDVGSFVEEARSRLAQELNLPPGVWTEWGGQFENLEMAKRRLAVVVPICFVLILLLLYATF
ncbi:MAG TPA: CusA/CzcA family heavy metal efflux RND transporter, partial [Terriglobales bacterium]|nr:CusA/CzcA family heavy metal efflux RND transporter [Terriglobales bacterium]